jgi:putative ABC transport system permease protein
MVLSRLNKKLLRDLARHWAQVAAIIAVISLGIIMFTGPLLATRDLNDSVNDIYRRTNYEDFSAQITSAPATAVSGVKGLPNVSAAEGRIVHDSQGGLLGRRLTLRVITVPDVGRPTVNGLILENGSYLTPGASGECMVEHHLSTELKLVPGTPLTITGVNGEVTFVISGSVVSPEYLRLVPSRSEYVTDPAQFGVVFVRYSDAARLFAMGGRVNEVVATVHNRNQKALQATMDATEVLLRPYGVTGLTTGSEEAGAVTLTLELQDVSKVALFFSILLFAVAALALYITMTQIVFSQQREIGVTRAIGYDRRDISEHYIGYGVVLGVAGSIIGVVAGYFLSRLFAHVYAGVFGLPLINTTIYYDIVLAGVAAGLVFSIAGALVPARHAVRMEPAEAMRTEAGLSLGRAGYSCKPRMTDRLGFPTWLRVSFRNLSRNRRRTVLTWLGVIGTVCVIVTATGGKDSIDFAVTKYLHGVIRWDVAAAWGKPIGKDMLARVSAIEGVKSVEPFIAAPGRVLAAGRSVDVQVQAFQKDTAMHGRYPTAGSKPQPGPAEVILNRGITTKLPVHIGSFVSISTPLNKTPVPFKVAGFVSEPFGGICYVNLEYVQALYSTVSGQADVFNGIAAKVAPGMSGRVAEQIRALPDVAQVITKSGIERIFKELVGAVKALFIIFYVMAFAMGFAVIFSMITVNLLERAREIATIRTLGAGRGLIFSFLTIETAVVVLAALIPGILLGRLLEWVIMGKLLTSERLVPDAVISWATVGFVIVAAFAVMLISELPSIDRLWRLDLAKVTKERAD